MARPNISHSGSSLLIAAEVLLISFLNYAVPHYLPYEMGHYVSLDVLYCLPILQTARLATIHATGRSDSRVATLFGITVAVIWSGAELIITWPDFPISAFVLNTFTRSVAFTVIGRVVTKLWRDRRSEQRFKTLAAGTSEGVALTVHGKIIDVNEQLTRILGYERQELIGLSVADLIPDADRERVMANIQAGLDSRIEHAMLRKDGSHAIVEAHGQTIEQDSVPLRLTAISDITERRKAERELQAAKAEAERANNAKSRFLAAASHDLRQPLAALQLYVDVLKNRLDPEHQVLLKNMDKCVAGLSDLLSKLLDLSKLDAGVVTPQASDVALDDIFNTVLAAHAPEAEAKGLGLRCRTNDLTVHTDRVLFQRILGNLVSNAIQYTKQGGVLIGCRRHRGRMWVEIWDTGVGIPQDKIGEIFEEFKQLGDGARNSGSGIGLTIAARTATLLGLKIRVQSRPNRGSMFAIELPLGQASRVATYPKRQGRLQMMRIAVVDDNPIVLDALVSALETGGNKLVAAATGHDLLARLGSRPPDVMVCDYRLAAGETGFDVITSVRQAFGSDLPAIIITGDTDPALLRSMAEKHIAIHHKPLVVSELKARIEEEMNKAHSLPTV